jgi:hypothetical protein
MLPAPEETTPTGCREGAYSVAKIFPAWVFSFSGRTARSEKTAGLCRIQFRVERGIPRRKGQLEKLRGQSLHNPGVGMLTKVMEPNAAVARTLNAGAFQYLVEGIAKGGDRIPPSSWVRKKRRLGKAGSEVVDGARAAVNEPRDQVRSKQHHSRFVVLGVADM